MASSCALKDLSNLKPSEVTLIMRTSPLSKPAAKHLPLLVSDVERCSRQVPLPE
jgi:hypothetical protein